MTDLKATPGWGPNSGRQRCASRRPVANWGQDSDPKRSLMTLRTLYVAAFLALPAQAWSQKAKSVDWPIYGGTTDNTRYSTLDQITPANVKQLEVAWTYDTHDEFPGSEFQPNPIVIDGVMYATTPKLRVVALDAATGREI